MDDVGPSARAGEIAADLFRRESARLVAMLAGQFGTHRLQLAEDVVQEALVRALQTWPYQGVPDNPAAWLTRTARNLALDHLRREQNWREKEDGIVQEHDRWTGVSGTREESPGTFADDTLRMMFVCFHPQLSAEAQTALALRTLCGFSAAEIAAAFLTSEAAVAKRLVRARQRIRELAVPFVVPGPDALPARLDGVLATLYLLFNEGHKASSGEHLVRAGLCHEAIRLAGLLAGHPVTGRPLFSSFTVFSALIWIERTMGGFSPAGGASWATPAKGAKAKARQAARRKLRHTVTSFIGMFFGRCFEPCQPWIPEQVEVGRRAVTVLSHD